MVIKLPQKRYNPDSYSIYRKPDVASTMIHVVEKISKGNVISPDWEWL